MGVKKKRKGQGSGGRAAAEQQRSRTPDRLTARPAAERQVSIAVPDVGRVSGLLLRPRNAKALFVFAHGAGAGMTHPFMAGVAERLAALQVATLRYNFPYMERGRGRPDVPRVAMAAVRVAVARAREEIPDSVCVAGGKSFGGRMTSTAQSESPLEGVSGLAFVGFPLHRPGVPGTERAEHLHRIDLPMLFLQGTRDSLADLKAITTVRGVLGAKASLHVIQDGDHSFKVPKSSGRTHEDVMTELAQVIADWANQL